MKLKVLLLTVSIGLSCLSVSFAEEKITLSTFYPAPYGDYDELTAVEFAANKAVIGPTYPFPANDGDLIVEGNVGIGTVTPQSPAPNGQQGNLDVNDVYLRSTSQWMSSSGGIPTGVIVMWPGSVASIPGGWQLCNGTSGTPDLRNRFIVGAGSSYNPGNTGGKTPIL